MRRHWTSHLRLLPGGDSDPAVGLGVSLLLYGVSLIFGLIFGLVASSQIAMNDPNLAWVSSLSVANALPAALLGFWILRRLRSTQPIDADVVAEKIAARDAARESKDWGAADAIRDELLAMKVEIMDSPDGTTWRIHLQEDAEEA